MPSNVLRRPTTSSRPSSYDHAPSTVTVRGNVLTGSRRSRSAPTSTATDASVPRAASGVPPRMPGSDARSSPGSHVRTSVASSRCHSRPSKDVSVNARRGPMSRAVTAGPSDALGAGVGTSRSGAVPAAASAPSGGTTV